MEELNLVLTEDGSNSIYSEKFKQQYHSLHGALQESMHVFIEAGLKYKQQSSQDISILEIGFGTGLNALLTLAESSATFAKINYTTIEKYPLSTDFIKQLNYCSIIPLDNCTEFFNQIHNCNWTNFNSITEDFLIRKINTDFETIDFKNEFDVIYFDAFAPNSQPELWTINLFQKMYDALKINGILVTYCAKGEVKRNLKAVGFEIEALAGPIGKREMTRAHKK